MSLAEKKQSFETTDLVEFLKTNPDIFERHPELLELLSLVDNRGTSSLMEKQVQQLKDRLSNFQSKQSEFIEVARENEQISESFSKIIYQLIGFKNLSEFASEFPLALRKTFEIDEVTFKTQQATALREGEKTVYQEASRRLVNNHAVCDNRWPNSIIALFFSGDIKSAALIPMRDNIAGNTIGVLALGSKDAQRYTHELGTAHLDRLGIMTGICLSRLQPSQ
ncbi:MAG: DUF484 family protein [Acidiferrobacterales bacterium]|nr:DUF484 family protein [Acidiferrobacterales bacterium]